MTPAALRCRLPIRLCGRPFSTSAARPISLQLERNHPEAVADTVPAYPYGPARWYKQSDRGLYGGVKIRFGNNVGPKFQTKTRRTFKPNIKNKRLWSHALQRFVQVRVSTRVLRTLDKVGGLDEYLLGEKEARIRELGMSGWWLRWAIMQTPRVRNRFAQERRELGIPALQAELENLSVSPESPVLEKATMESEGNEQDQSEISALQEEIALQELEDADGGDEAGIESLAITSDDAFQIESTPDLPTLKFRVGPNQHIVLTPDGWRRVRPNPEKLANDTKKYIEETKFKGYEEVRMRAVRTRLEEEMQQIERQEEYTRRTGKGEKGQEKRKDKWNKSVKLMEKAGAEGMGVKKMQGIELLEAAERQLQSPQSGRKTVGATKKMRLMRQRKRTRGAAGLLEQEQDSRPLSNAEMARVLEAARGTIKEHLRENVEQAYDEATSPGRKRAEIKRRKVQAKQRARRLRAQERADEVIEA